MEKFLPVTPSRETLKSLTAKVGKVSDTYAKNCDIRRDEDWYLLKLQEELGELTAEALRLSGRGRRKDMGDGEIRERMGQEAGDLFAHLLLFASYHDIDLEAELHKKWFKYLK